MENKKVCKCMEKMNSDHMLLVEKWTKSAQSSSNTDDERNIYYQCAEELFSMIQGEKNER